MRRAQLVIMLKVPRAGRVKTRLGRDIGMTTAAWWARHQVAALLRNLDDPRWQLTLAVAPDVEGLQSRVWPRKFARVAQGQGDLGDRMARVMRDMPHGPVCIIGGDIPGVRRHHIARAFGCFGGHDAVFGPAPDGGFWLVGMKRVVPNQGMFENVRWSSKYALEDSMASMKRARIALIDQLRDVDTVQDLRAAHRPSRV